MSDTSNPTEYGKLIIDGILGIFTIIFGWLTYSKSNKIKALEEEKEYLKKKIHKVTSKVDPESDRKLLVQANNSVQIMGINSLGPLHHCREEIIEFLSTRKGTLQVVLLDPGCDAFCERETLEKDHCMRLLTEWRASICILRDIHSQAGESPLIELRLRTDRPDRSLFIIDAVGDMTDKTKMLINYYPNEVGTRGYSGGQFLAEFVMERDRDSIFKNIKFFQDCWDLSKPISLEKAIKLVSEVEHTRMSSGVA